MMPLRTFIRDKRGVAATEFAIIAPFMITLFLGMVELSDWMMASRRVTVVTSTAADLVGQTQQISNSDMADVFEASRLIMAPYDLGSIQMRITSVTINLDGTMEVGWSDGYNMSPLSVGESYVLPENIGFPGGSIIVSEVTYNYTPVINFITSGTIDINDEFYVLPRRTLAVTRVN